MSNALTVPSRDADTRNFLLLANVTAVTLDVCSWNVTKQNPDCVFHNFTCDTVKGLSKREVLVGIRQMKLL